MLKVSSIRFTDDVETVYDLEVELDHSFIHESGAVLHNSTICRGLSGQTWKITEDHPRPPAHPSCRSTLTYLLSGQPLPDDPSYNEWLKRQPESFIASTLPVWQKEQFDKGVPLKAFVTKDIQPLTMAEFKARK